MKPTFSLSRQLVRSVINPVKHTPLDTLKSLPFTPKSLLYIPNTRTSVNAQQHVNSLLSENPNLQIITAVLDSVHQDIASELWFDDFMRIRSGKNLDNDAKNKPSLTLGFSGEILKIPLVRTTGFTNFDYTLNMKHNGTYLLDELDVWLPLKTGGISSWSHLHRISESRYNITSHLDNVIKQIDNRPASSVLMNELKQNGINENQPLYVQIGSQYARTNFYEIIAGGGEYGAKSEMLVLDCDKIPEALALQVQFCLPVPQLAIPSDNGGMIVDRIQDSKRIVDQGEDVIKDNFIRFGSEKGFQLSGYNLQAPNDFCSVRL